MPDGSEHRSAVPADDRHRSDDATALRTTELPDIPGLVRDRLDRWRADVKANRFEPVVRTLMKAAAAVERFDGAHPTGDEPRSDRSGVQGTRNPAELLASLADDVLDYGGAAARYVRRLWRSGSGSRSRLVLIACS